MSGGQHWEVYQGSDGLRRAVCQGVERQEGFGVVAGEGGVR